MAKNGIFNPRKGWKGTSLNPQGLQLHSWER